MILDYKKFLIQNKTVLQYFKYLFFFLYFIFIFIILCQNNWLESMF